MTRAKFISTEGPYGEAVIEIASQRLCVYDEFSVNKDAVPLAGAECELEFFVYFDNKDEVWEDVFSSNLDQRIGIEQIDGWKYRAYGKIIDINPVRIDCGLLIQEGVIATHDPRVIGEYVAFTIARLGAYVHAI